MQQVSAVKNALGYFLCAAACLWILAFAVAQHGDAAPGRTSSASDFAFYIVAGAAVTTAACAVLLVWPQFFRLVRLGRQTWTGVGSNREIGLATAFGSAAMIWVSGGTYERYLKANGEEGMPPAPLLAAVGVAGVVAGVFLYSKHRTGGSGT